MTLYLVACEDEDGMFLDDPDYFDDLDAARKYANELDLPVGSMVVVYRCSVEMTIEKLAKLNTT